MINIVLHTRELSDGPQNALALTLLGLMSFIQTAYLIHKWRSLKCHLWKQWPLPVVWYPSATVWQFWRCWFLSPKNTGKQKRRLDKSFVTILKFKQKVSHFKGRSVKRTWGAKCETKSKKQLDKAENRFWVNESGDLRSVGVLLRNWDWAEITDFSISCRLNEAKVLKALARNHYILNFFAHVSVGHMVQPEQGSQDFPLPNHFLRLLQRKYALAFPL